MSLSRTSPPLSVDKSLALLVHALEGDFASMSALASAAGLPLSTAHRLLTGLQQAGFIVPVSRGRYISGPTLRRLARPENETNRILVQIAAPILAKLSRRTSRICHLGVLEDGMMTYLIKEGDAEDHALSRQGMQLEAYCTGLGKALLAHMPEPQRNDYLSSGTFVALTPHTLTTPEALSAEFDRIRRSGYALDEQEILPGLVCIAVPIQLEGRVIAAISLVVTHKGGPVRPQAYFARLRAAAIEIELRLQPFSDMLQL
ncbi:IclR family transcriptional regulator [Sphingobium sp. LB126]|uniref:IclR family transcriptional regulator n=1 Tax=Sphingobium sp. LB126 TaxID=1983755 RepID=UPI000C207E49|nr:IclR family transcriptional regulator [Sphingobium sp. LB126]